jgi:uncharacterized protein
MNLEAKSEAVREIFGELEVEVKSYFSASKLSCFEGCGRCCNYPKINASVLEFLPLAFDIYKKGKAEEILDSLYLEEIAEGTCILYKPTSEDKSSGYCTDYKNRGLICRLFGNSARKNKTGEKVLLTCTKIKTDKTALFLSVSESIKNELAIPLGTDKYAGLIHIDSQLTEEQFPINIAIRKSLEAVLRYMYYLENQEI